MAMPSRTPTSSRRRFREIEERLAEAEQALLAIRTGEVDALVVSTGSGEEVYTLKSADQPYRVFLQTMREGALTLTPEGLILYANQQFSAMVGMPLEEVIGSQVQKIVSPEYSAAFAGLLAGAAEGGSRGEIALTAGKGSPVPVRVSASRLSIDGASCLCLVMTDLTAEKRNEQRLRTLAASLISAQEEEQRRLARELHDDLAQRLSALVIEIHQLETQYGGSAPSLGGRLRALGAKLAELTGQVGETARGLHPSILDLLGLRPALEAHCAEYGKREGVVTKFRHRDVPDSLSKDVALNIYRIAQECLRNVSRHSQAKKVTVTLAGEDSGIRLSVEDTGVGFDPDVQRDKPGLGLVSMAERARMIRGELSVRSRIGRGTTVELWAPLI